MTPITPLQCFWLGPLASSTQALCTPYFQITPCQNLTEVASRLKRYPWAAILINTAVVESHTSYLAASLRDLLTIHQQPATALVAISLSPSLEEEGKMLGYGFTHYHYLQRSPRNVALAITTYQQHLEALLSALPSLTGNHSPQQPTPSPNLPLSQALGGRVPQWHRITPREREILQFIGQGATNRHIAQQLCISPTTVKNHLAHVFKKLQVANRTQAAYVAQQFTQTAARLP